jgi:hypothetical protein
MGASHHVVSNKPERIEQVQSIATVHICGGTELTSPEISAVGVDLGVEEVKVTKANGVLAGH